MRLIVAALAIISFVACDKSFDDHPYDGGTVAGGAVSFVAALYEQGGSTRVENNIWDSDDFIGVSTSGSADDQNLNYQASSSGKLTSTDDNHTISVVNNNSYYAYYPYDKDLKDGVKTISLLGQESMESFSSYDLMWAKQEGVSAAQSMVYLYFKRQLTLVNVTICFKGGATFDSESGIKIKGVYTEGTFNTFTGELATSGAQGMQSLKIKSIDNTSVVDGVNMTTVKAEGVFFPMSGKDITLSYVTTDSSTSSNVVSCMDGITWKSGHSYDYTICEDIESYSLSQITEDSYPEGNLWIINDMQPTDQTKFDGLCAALEVAGDTESAPINLYFPNLEVMPHYAMAACNGYFTISMPSLTKINSEAFVNCVSLLSVYAPNLTDVGKNAFSDCQKLATFTADKLTNLGMYALSQCSSLVDISLPNLLSLDLGAFYICNGLEKIDLPMVSYIGDYAFCHCTALTTINVGYLSDGITYLAENWLLDASDTEGIDLDISPKLPSGVSISGSTLTYDDGSSDTFKSIGTDALTLSSFAGGNEPTTLLNATTWVILDYNSNNSYSSTNFDGLRTVLNNRSEPIKLSFPYLEYLPDGALKDCANVTSIELANIKNIGTESLSGCPSLELITLGSSEGHIDVIESGWLTNVESELIVLEVKSSLNDTYSIVDNMLIYDGGNTLYFKTLNGDGFSLLLFDSIYNGICPYPTRAEWYITEGGSPDSDSYKYLREAIEACRYEVSLIFSDVETLARDAFFEVDNLKKVTLESAKTINYQALYGCNNLQEVYMPVASYIGSFAFAKCGSLDTVSLPLAMVLGSGLFFDCGSLTNLYISTEITTKISSFDHDCFEAIDNRDQISLNICNKSKLTSEIFIIEYTDDSDTDSSVYHELLFIFDDLNDCRNYNFGHIYQN